MPARIGLVFEKCLHSQTAVCVKKIMYKLRI